jgi:dGTPase
LIIKNGKIYLIAISLSLKISQLFKFEKMNWEQLLSLKRQGDTSKRLRIEQDDTRLGFEVDYDRIIFSAALEVYKIKQVIPLSKQTLCTRV